MEQSSREQTKEWIETAEWKYTFWHPKIFYFFRLEGADRKLWVMYIHRNRSIGRPDLYIWDTPADEILVNYMIEAIGLTAGSYDIHESLSSIFPTGSIDVIDMFYK